MSAAIVPVTGTFLNADGTAAAGTVTFKLSQPFANGGVIYHMMSFTATLDGSGHFSQNLAANDGIASPSGTFYSVTEKIDNAPEREYVIQAPQLAAPQNITGVSTANPGVVTVPNHGYVTGDTVTIASVGGATQANGTWDITVLTVNTFSIPVDVTGTYTSGGTSAIFADLSILMPNSAPGIGGS